MTGKKPYWTHKGSQRKFYTFEAAQESAEIIEKMGFPKPPTTYHRMFGAIWVTTTSEGKTEQ